MSIYKHFQHFQTMTDFELSAEFKVLWLALNFEDINEEQIDGLYDKWEGLIMEICSRFSSTSGLPLEFAFMDGSIAARWGE